MEIKFTLQAIEYLEQIAQTKYFNKDIAILIGEAVCEG